MKSLKMLVLCRYNVECCNNGRFSNEFNAYFFHLFPPCCEILKMILKRKETFYKAF